MSKVVGRLLMGCGLGIVAFLIYMGSKLFSAEPASEFSDKEEWSILQVASEIYRENPSALPTTVKKEGYSILGLEAKNGDVIWVLLNPESDISFKALPDNKDYSIDAEFLDRLAQSEKISPYVLSELRRHALHRTIAR